MAWGSLGTRPTPGENPWCLNCTDKTLVNTPEGAPP